MRSLKLYFITDIVMDSLTPIIYPKIPKKIEPGEDTTTPRICCALSPYGCIHGLGLDFWENDPDNRVWFLYSADVPVGSIVRPTEEQLPDSLHNDELWVTIPTRFNLVGTYNIRKHMELGNAPYSRYAFTRTNEDEVVDKVGGTAIYGDLDSFSYIGFDMKKYLDHADEYAKWII